jgi:hypothetical protein
MVPKEVVVFCKFDSRNTVLEQHAMGRRQEGGGCKGGETTYDPKPC